MNFYDAFISYGRADSKAFAIAWLLLHLPPLVAVSFLRGLCWFFYWLSWLDSIAQLLV